MKVIQIGLIDLYEKLISNRFLASVILLTAIIAGMVTGYDTFMTEKQEWITPWMAPHIFTNWAAIMMYGLIVCYMYSDVPFMNQSELYWVLREGRIKWCLGKIIGILLEGLCLSLLTIIISIVIFIPHLRFSLEWGKVIYTTAYSPSEEMISIYAKCYPSIIENYTPLQAMGLFFLLLSLVTCLAGLLMFTLSIYKNRYLALIAGISLSGSILVVDTFFNLRWIDFFIPFEWCRLGMYNQPINFGTYFPSMKYCVGMSIGLSILCVIMLLLRMRHIEFDWVREE